MPQLPRLGRLCGCRSSTSWLGTIRPRQSPRSPRCTRPLGHPAWSCSPPAQDTRKKSSTSRTAHVLLPSGKLSSLFFAIRSSAPPDSPDPQCLGALRHLRRPGWVVRRTTEAWVRLSGTRQVGCSRSRRRADHGTRGFRRGSVLNSEEAALAGSSMPRTCRSGSCCHQGREVVVAIVGEPPSGGPDEPTGGRLSSRGPSVGWGERVDCAPIQPQES